MKHIYKFKAMSTLCELIAFEQDKNKADIAAQDILKTTKELEKKYNYYDPNSYLSKINTREIKRLDIQTKTLLQRAIKYYHKTNKIFDVTIATIKDIYTTTDTINNLLKQKEFLLPFVGCEHFEIKHDKIKFNNPYTKIDLGGFVKEYAVDMAIKVLQKRKIKNALVNFGGDIFALGRKPNGEKIKIGIKNPLNPKTFYQFVEIENESLTTSASYERNYKIENQLFSHIISKNTTSKQPLSVSVISNNCVESGVFSTSLMIDLTLKTKNKTIIISSTISDKNKPSD